MLQPEALADIPADLIEPGEGPQNRVFLSGGPVEAAIALQDPEKGGDIFCGTQKAYDFVVFSWLLSAEIALLQDMGHQLSAERIVCAAAEGQISPQPQIKLTHPGHGDGQGFQPKLPHPGRKVRFPDFIRQRPVCEHHPVDDLPQAETAFHVNIDVLQQYKSVDLFWKHGESIAFRGNGSGCVDPIEDPAVQ